jgi:hypothetical protein
MVSRWPSHRDDHGLYRYGYVTGMVYCERFNNSDMTHCFGMNQWRAFLFFIATSSIEGLLLVAGFTSEGEGHGCALIAERLDIQLSQNHPGNRWKRGLVVQIKETYISSLQTSITYTVQSTVHTPTIPPFYPLNIPDMLCPPASTTSRSS